MAGHRDGGYHVNINISPLVRAIEFFNTVSLSEEALKELYSVAKSGSDELMSDPMSLLTWKAEIDGQGRNGITIGPSKRLMEFFVDALDEDGLYTS